MASMLKVLLLNGPNLNMVGTREPALYGNQTLDEIMEGLRGCTDSLSMEMDVIQSNFEGELIQRIQDAPDSYNFVIVNPGALTHTSVAIRDAIAAINIPVIEVHITNIAARESWRNKSVISEVCWGSIMGLGAVGYRLALEAGYHLFHNVLNIDQNEEQTTLAEMAQDDYLQPAPEQPTLAEMAQDTYMSQDQPTLAEMAQVAYMQQSVEEQPTLAEMAQDTYMSPDQPTLAEMAQDDYLQAQPSNSYMRKPALQFNSSSSRSGGVTISNDEDDILTFRPKARPYQSSSSRSGVSIEMVEDNDTNNLTISSAANEPEPMFHDLATQGIAVASARPKPAAIAESEEAPKKKKKRVSLELVFDDNKKLATPAEHSAPAPEPAAPRKHSSLELVLPISMRNDEAGLDKSEEDSDFSTEPSFAVSDASLEDYESSGLLPDYGVETENNFATESTPVFETENVVVSEETPVETEAEPVIEETPVENEEHHNNGGGRKNKKGWRKRLGRR